MKIYQVDAFASRMFTGNPAGVCILKSPAEEKWMQDIAMEMNLAETAFLYRQDNIYELRWFTPETEVDLCGHATLASAHILWETGFLDCSEEAIFSTKSGILTAKKDRDNIVLNFPSEEDTEVCIPEEIKSALGVELLYAGQNRMDYIIEVASEDVVRALKPDMELLKKIGKRGVIVTGCSLTGTYDFVSRFFAPGVGISEDPVTGSAHCCLGPYWKRKLGKSEFTAYQASKRGGMLQVKVCGDRVHIGGKAVTVFCADLFRNY